MVTHGPEADRQQVQKLRWRCRRGMRELDQLLTRYLEQRYPSASARERDAFARLLELPDPDVFGYLVGGITPDEEVLRHVVACIRRDPSRVAPPPLGGTGL
jgi:antitoxin CptB